MSVFLQPIYTQTVGSGGASTITFNSIPQTFTDLMCVNSARTGYSGDADAYMWFNGSQGTAYSWTKLQGTGSGVATYRASNTDVLSPWTLKGDGTANTFGNAQIYIPYYTQSGFKQVVSESVVENNATLGFTTTAAGLWRNTSAITTISFTVAGGFTQHSTFTLYGITKG